MADDDFTPLPAQPSGTGGSSEDFTPIPHHGPFGTPPSPYNYGQAIEYGLVNSIPFGRDIGAAAETYLPRSLSGAPPEATGNYAENRARINATNAGIERDYPITSAVTPLVGAAATLPIAGPVGAVRSGIASVAPRLGGLASDALASGVVGGGYGALYGAGSGDSLSDRAARAETGAALGSIGGTAVPVVAGGLGRLGAAGLAAARPFIGNPQTEATGAIAKAMSTERAAGAQPALGPFDYFQGQVTGQPVMTGDLGGATTRDLATWAANVSPEARGIMSGPVNERFASQGPRFSDYISNLFGGNLDAQVARDRITAGARATNAPAYQRAYADGAGGVWTPGIENLIRAPDMQSAISDATRKGANSAVLNGQPIVKNPFVQGPNGLTLAQDAQGNRAIPTLQYWDQVKRSLDDKISTAQRSGNLEDARDFGQLKSSLVGELDNAVPSYAAARQGASGFFKADNALQAGENFLGMSKVADIDGMRKAISNYTPAEQQMFARGLASQIAQKAENSSERRNIVNLFNSPATAEKMQLGLGPNMSNDIEAYLRRESALQMLNNSVNSGSDTTRKLMSVLGNSEIGHTLRAATTSPVVGAALGAGAGFHETPDWNVHEMGRNMAIGAAGGAFAGLMGKQVQGFNRQLAVNIAQKMVSDDPTEVQQAMQTVARNPKLMDGLRRVEGSLSYLSGTRPQAPDQSQ